MANNTPPKTRRVIVYLQQPTFQRMRAEAFSREVTWTDLVEQAVSEWLTDNGTAPAALYADEAGDE